MGDISWARQLPERVIINVPPMYKIPEPRERMVQMSRATFERINDYTRSQPTSPSAGRIYRKNFGWPKDMEDNWSVYFCVRDPDDPKGVYHVPYTPILTDTALPLRQRKSRRVRA
jgi:hypothetical protein